MKLIQSLISDKRGGVSATPGVEAFGMKGGSVFRLEKKDLIKLPAGSQIFMLPKRVPIGYDRAGEAFAVAAFLAPGFTATYNSAYIETGKPKTLPLFSYAAVVSYKGDIYTAAVRVDKDIRHDSQFIKMALVRKNIKRFREIFPDNHLVRHLERCALRYGCPNAQNFFLSRFEAPLPVSPRCNAYCAGCISYQPNKACPATQPRIDFVPTPKETAEVALFHISCAKDPIVSFGQGCEGEPLLAGDVIEKSIQLVRNKTRRGTININTNGSRPQMIARLFDKGLDSVRISMNSVREEYYKRYYRPRGYSFKDVIKSAEVAKRKGGFISINYLTMPGFTDSEDEFTALKDFIRRYKVDMIQWRNLNFDPVRYFQLLRIRPGRDKLLGIREIIADIKKEFPQVRNGYFNPPLDFRESRTTKHEPRD